MGFAAIGLRLFCSCCTFLKLILIFILGLCDSVFDVAVVRATDLGRT